MIKLNQSILLTLTLSLGGCSTGGQDHFSTEPGKGYGWKSMSETHQHIQKEMVGGDMGTISPQPYVVTSASLGEIQRLPEQYLRIWLPPYQDAQGNLHEESSIQTVIRSGQWQVPDPKIDEHRKA